MNNQNWHKCHIGVNWCVRIRCGSDCDYLRLTSVCLFFSVLW